MRVIHLYSTGTRPATVLAFVLVMLAIAVGHVLVIAEYTTFYYGIPAWLWLHLVVVLVLLGMAWVLVEHVLAGGDR